MKVIIIGGVAGGASCAARLRRLDENAEIVMVERGPYVSYANCGLPYHVGGIIPEESELMVATAEMFKALFKVDARTNCEAIDISPEQKTVDLRDVETGEITTESYDKLVLSPGAPPIRPPLPGIYEPFGYTSAAHNSDGAARTPGTSVSGWRKARRSWPGCTGIWASRPCGRRPARWSWAAVSSGWR